MRWFVYIVMFLLVATAPSSAKQLHGAKPAPFASIHYTVRYSLPLVDTIIKKHPPDEDEKRIKEVQKAKRQSKPEKIDNEQPVRRRERRPEGMERPPEIPRRNNN